MPSRTHPHIARWLLAVLCTLTLSTACTARGTPGTDPKALNTAVAQQIQTELAGQPGVVTARVVYQDNLTTPGSAAVDLSVEPGADVDATIDTVVRAVWLSKLNPLSTIRVGIVYYQSQQSGTVKNLIVKDQQAQLEQKYGPRPTP